jgi:hypothetical protein
MDKQQWDELRARGAQILAEARWAEEAEAAERGDAVVEAAAAAEEARQKDARAARLAAAYALAATQAEASAGNQAAPWSEIIAKVEAEPPRDAKATLAGQQDANHGWGAVIEKVAAERGQQATRWHP